MVEFRLYYNENGTVLCYTCDTLPDNDRYIVIDKDVYALSDPYVRVIDGKIVRKDLFITTSKLVYSTNGISCAKEDVCIITADEPTNKWKVETYEFRNS